MGCLENILRYYGIQQSSIKRIDNLFDKEYGSTKIFSNQE